MRGAWLWAGVLVVVASGRAAAAPVDAGTPAQNIDFSGEDEQGLGGDELAPRNPDAVKFHTKVPYADLLVDAGPAAPAPVSDGPAEARPHRRGACAGCAAGRAGDSGRPAGAAAGLLLLLGARLLRGRLSGPRAGARPGRGRRPRAPRPRRP